MPASSTATALPFTMTPEPLAPNLFGDVLPSNDATQSSASKGTADTQNHAELIRHLIRTVYDAVECGTVSNTLAVIASAGSSVSPQSSPAAAALHTLTQSQATNEFDDSELAFRLQ